MRSLWREKVLPLEVSTKGVFAIVSMTIAAGSIPDPLRAIAIGVGSELEWNIFLIALELSVVIPNSLVIRTLNGHC